MDLFHIQEEGPGVIFWHPRGFAIYRLIEDYIRRRMQGAGFKELRTPQLLARSLWEASGHWQKFSENMFSFGDEERVFALVSAQKSRHQVIIHWINSLFSITIL
jgi:threonyl-tRNA synthetase